MVDIPATYVSLLEGSWQMSAETPIFGFTPLDIQTPNLRGIPKHRTSGLASGWM